MCFTAEDIWAHLPRRKDDPDSVHLALFPTGSPADAGLVADHRGRNERGAGGLVARREDGRLRRMLGRSRLGERNAGLGRFALLRDDDAGLAAQRQGRENDESEEQPVELHGDLLAALGRVVNE